MSDQSESTKTVPELGCDALFGMLNRGLPPNGMEALAAFTSPNGAAFWVLGKFIRFSENGEMWMRRDGDHQPIPTTALIGWISLPNTQEDRPRAGDDQS